MCAVFNPNTASLTPAYRAIAEMLNNRATIEAGRQDPLSMGSHAFDVLGQTLSERRKNNQRLLEKQQEHDFDLDKLRVQDDYETRRMMFQESLRDQLDAKKSARDAAENEKQRAHERRNEVQITADKRVKLEQELGLDEGMLADLDGRSMKQDDMEAVIQNAFKKMVADIKSEPGKDETVAKIGGKDVKYGETKQFADQGKRLRKAVVQASGKDAIDDISKAEFAGGGNGAGLKLSPADIKGGIMMAMMQNGYESLSPEQKMIIDSEINKDPAMDKAIRIYGQGGLGFGKKPGEAYAEVTQLANQMRNDSIARANSDKIVGSMTPKQQAVFKQNVDGAVDAIKGGEDYNTIMASLQSSNPAFYDALKKEIDAKLKRA